MSSEKNTVLASVAEDALKAKEAVDLHFGISQQKTSFGQELLAGLLNFLSALPVFAFVPRILVSAGIGYEDCFFVILVASCVGTFVVSLVAKKPLVVVPSISVAIFVSVTVVLKMGLSIHVALLCCFVESLLFFFLSISNLRDKLIGLFPRNLRFGFAAGIGLWLIFLSLRLSGLITISQNEFLVVPTFQDPCVIIAFVGILAVCVFSYWKLKGAFLYAFALTWLLAMVAQWTGWYQVDEAHVSMVPTAVFEVPSWIQTAGLCFDFTSIYNQFTSVFSLGLTLLMIVMTLFFMDSVESSAILLSIYPPEEVDLSSNNVLKSKQVFAASALSSLVASILGGTTQTISASSAVGVKLGGKTSLSSLLTAVLIMSMVFLAPLFSSIPVVALVPVVFYVGLLLLRNFTKISFDNMSEFVPALITLVFVGFSFSPIYGLAVGTVAYTLINIFCGKIKKITAMVWVMTVLSLAFLIFV